MARRIAVLRSFYGYLVRAGHRDDDPSTRLDSPKVHRGLPRPVAELDRKLESLEAPFDLIAVFLAETGLRISEACGVYARVPVPEELVVYGKGAKERLVVLTEPAREALNSLGGWIPFRPRTIEKHFQAAGFKPHQLRHHLGCELAASGAELGEVQELLGHASPATTRIYMAYDTSRLRRAQERRKT